MRKNARIAVAFGGGELTGKGHEGAFWSDGQVWVTQAYAFVKTCRMLYLKSAFHYVNFTKINKC